MKKIQKDVLIIGSGLSGIYSSLHLDMGLSVGIVTKDTLNHSNSALAQGGIASCMNKEDSFSNHISDTLLAGSYKNNIDAVELLVSEAPTEIHHLIEMGVKFDHDEQGIMLATLEGGHSHRRVLHANGDATGKAIMETVIHQMLNRKNIEILEKTMAVEIVLNKESKVVGVIVLNQEEFVFIETTYVVIASGGVGALFKDTTNQGFSTGDGLALAKKAGCELVDMCFIQFHPTAFYGEKTDKRFLITEALRGEGAILRNRHMEAFMVNYDKRGDLAPRDVVAQAIYNEMSNDQRSFLWLDTTHLEKAFLKSRFPTIYQFLLDQGIHMDMELIPIAPVAHYFVGGIGANLNGETTVDGIYACGEVSSTGVHGANRLASNSLLECIVFGRRVADDLNHKLTVSVKKPEAEKLILEKELQYNLLQSRICKRPSYEDCRQKEYKKLIQSVMTKYVGIVRKDNELLKALKEIKEVQIELKKDDNICTMYYEVNNMCEVSMEIIEDALLKDSVGCHYKLTRMKEVCGV